jgi:transcriptional regulator with XRE-family HTH domain
VVGTFGPLREQLGHRARPETVSHPAVTYPSRCRPSSACEREITILQFDGITVILSRAVSSLRNDRLRSYISSVSRTRYVVRDGGAPVAIDTGSTVPRRQLGRFLRQLREEAQITVKVAAEELEWSAPKIWRIESGATSMRALDVEAMCRVYGAPAHVTEALKGLARETKAKGWWHSFGEAIPEWFELYVGLEAAASRLREYGPELVPGLLQTESYTAEVFRVGNPDISEDKIKEGVAVRLERQAILTRARPTPPTLDVVINEATLRRPITDLAAMADQLSHISKISELPNVSVRVLPLSAGLHRAAMVGGMFIILDFTGNGETRNPEPSTVYSDGLTGALYLDKPQEVAAYNKVWSSLISSCLDQRSSRKLISAIAKEYASP